MQPQERSPEKRMKIVLTQQSACNCFVASCMLHDMVNCCCRSSFDHQLASSADSHLQRPWTPNETGHELKGLGSHRCSDMLPQSSLIQGGRQVVEAEAGPRHDKVGAAKLEVLLFIDAPADVLCLCRHPLPSSRCLIYPPLLSLQKGKLYHCPDHAWLNDLLSDQSGLP